MNVSRRDFLALTIAATVGQSPGGTKRDMLIRSARPQDLEMPRQGFLDYITPIERFFVRSHVYVPQVDVKEWRLRIGGAVAGPLTLSMEDLRRLPGAELVSVLECAGNGRGFYEPSVPGLQWTDGAVGNGRWRGVRLADVLQRAGLAAAAREILFEGADVPLGTMPDFQRSIPLAKALDPSTLLAYDMNGAPLPPEHGFPLRVVVPGWAGDSWIKWITQITVLDKEHEGFWMARAYRHPGRPVQPGTAVTPEKMQPVTSLRVKSVIAAPLDSTQVVTGTSVSIRGAAWSGDAAPVTAVEVSIDGGRHWNAARMHREQHTQFGWRLWEYDWRPTREAYYTIFARARDGAGQSQPLEQEWNPSGYGWNVVPRIRVNVVNQPPPETTPTQAGASATVPPTSFKSRCVTCHDDDVIRQQRLTRAQWDAEINKMVNWGAKVPAEDRNTLLDYLVSTFGPRPRM
jgi:DMSO/TMAO reductase YedYZ molybdopterin-dependent catalytic subunit